MFRFLILFLSCFLIEGCQNYKFRPKLHPIDIKKLNKYPRTQMKRNPVSNIKELLKKTFISQDNIPKPTPIRKKKDICNIIQSFDDCVRKIECSWCKIHLLEEGCYLTDMTDLLPTTERCIDGGDPIPIEEVPQALCGHMSFDDCELLPTIDYYYGHQQALK